MHIRVHCKLVKCQEHENNGNPSIVGAGDASAAWSYTVYRISLLLIPEACLLAVHCS